MIPQTRLALVLTTRLWTIEYWLFRLIPQLTIAACLGTIPPWIAICISLFEINLIENVVGHLNTHDSRLNLANSGLNLTEVRHYMKNEPMSYDDIKD